MTSTDFYQRTRRMALELTPEQQRSLQRELGESSLLRALAEVPAEVPAQEPEAPQVEVFTKDEIDELVERRAKALNYRYQNELGQRIAVGLFITFAVGLILGMLWGNAQTARRIQLGDLQPSYYNASHEVTR